jgi:hypothetical protein
MDKIAITSVLALALSVFEASAADKIPRQLDKAHRSIAGVELDATSREQVLKVLGYTPAWPRPNQSEDPISYCYQFESPTPAWLILSFGSFEAFERLDSALVTTNRQKLNGPCSQTSLQAAKLATQSGLRLGLRRAEVQRIIQDKPTSQQGALAKYEYEFYEKYPEPIKRPDTPGRLVGYYHDDAIEVRFRNDELSEFAIRLSGEADWK